MKWKLCIKERGKRKKRNLKAHNKIGQQEKIKTESTTTKKKEVKQRSTGEKGEKGKNK